MTADRLWERSVQHRRTGFNNNGDIIKRLDRGGSGGKDCLNIFDTSATTMGRHGGVVEVIGATLSWFTRSNGRQHGMSDFGSRQISEAEDARCNSGSIETNSTEQNSNQHDYSETGSGKSIGMRKRVEHHDGIRG
jgi:hypothetical protein